MRERILLQRFLAVPLRQKLVAGGIAVAVGIGFFAWSRHDALRSAATAVLSFDADTAWETGPRIMSAHAQEPAVTFAQSILSDAMVEGLAKQAGAKSHAEEFRSRLEMAQPSAQLLHIYYHDADKNLSAAAANAVANMLVAWRPFVAAAPAVFAPVPAAPMLSAPPAAQPHRHRRISHPQSDTLHALEEQLTATDQKLAALTAVSQPAATPRKESAGTTPPSTDNEQRRVLELQLAAAQKKLDELRVRYTDEYPDVETAKENIAEIREKLASIQVPRHEAEPAASSQKQDAGGADVNQLRLERARLEQAIAVERRHEATQRDQAAPADGGKTVSPALPRQASDVPSENQAAGRSLHSPFTLVRLAGNGVANPGEGGSFWQGALAGILWGLLYLGGAMWRYRPIAGAAASNNMPNAEKITDNSPDMETSWEEEIRRAIALTDLNHEEALAGGGPLQGFQGQRRHDEMSEAIGKRIKKEPNSWMAHTEEARTAIEMGDFDTAIKEMNHAITVAPEKLKAPLGRIVTQMDRNVNINK